jgi:dTDP-4-amino-4,6-dideoxygalactose transaminase
MDGNEKYIQEALTLIDCANRANLTIFEQNLESYLGAGHIAVLNSGTAAIHLGFF